MLALMGLHLVPFVETLCAAPVITLKQRHPSVFEAERSKERAGRPYLVRFLLRAVNSSHVVLHAGVCDEGLGTTLDGTPEHHNSYKSHKKAEHSCEKRGLERLTCEAFPRCGSAGVWSAGSGCRSSCCSSRRRRVSATAAKRPTRQPQKQRLRHILKAPALTSPVCLQR